MKKIGLIGQFPGPLHGLSKALETLYNSRLSSKYDFIKINITDNKKFIFNVLKLLYSKYDLYYLTISQSKWGNIRDLIIIKLIQMKKRKIIIHLHGGGFRKILDEEFNTIQKSINYSILSKVDGGIVLGESLRYIFEGIIDEKKIYIVKNCVDNQFLIKNEQFYEKLNQIKTKKNINILYLSNFIESKGYKYVLELAKKMSENNEHIKFSFAGKFFDEISQINFKNYISEHNLEHIVKYYGVVDGDEKKELFIKNDIFILLTSYKNEGQPISIIEAAANGNFVISTNYSGIKDILPKDNIYLYNPEQISIDIIYNDIINLYKNKQFITETLISNRNHIMNEFSEIKYINSLSKIFDEILMIEK